MILLGENYPFSPGNWDSVAYTIYFTKTPYFFFKYCRNTFWAQCSKYNLLQLFHLGQSNIHDLQQKFLLGNRVVFTIYSKIPFGNSVVSTVYGKTVWGRRCIHNLQQKLLWGDSSVFVIYGQCDVHSTRQTNKTIQIKK